ncbi:MAG: AMP-binding protein, partial [Actinomycetes bacterium]
VQGARTTSYAELAGRTDRLASLLLAHGVGRRAAHDEVAPWESPHEHLALYLLNCPEYLEGMLAAWKAGATTMNVNYRYVADELAFLLDDGRARAVLVHRRFLPMLADVLGRLADPPRLVLVVEDGTDHPLPAWATPLEEALAAADPGVPDGVRSAWSGDDRYLCYTGGTTGSPKGTLWRQDDFLRAALGVGRKDGTPYGSLEDLLDAANPALRTLPAPPLMHGAAHWNALSCWMAGGTVVLQEVVDRFDPDDVLDAADRHGASSLLLVGDPMARPLAAALAHRDAPPATLRHVVSGGAVLSPGVRQRLLDLVPGLRVLDVLGSTESGRQGVATADAARPDPGGFLPARTAVVLSEDRSRRLRPGSAEVGWLAQTSRVPLGYLGHPDRTAATFPMVDGVRHAVPGDRARLQADGTVELLGRDSVCINTGGEKVFAEEVEVALTSHPEVVDAVVCGRPSDRFGQEVVAVVALADGATVTDDALCRPAGQHLARYKLPRAVVRVPEVVRSPSCKADYRWAAARVLSP